MVIPHRQRLLLDTDAFCKLGIAGLLSEAIAVFGANTVDCGRLAALPYMLRRGGLRDKFGNKACDDLMDLAQRIPVAIKPSERWLEPLASIAIVDPGEAQLMALSAEQGSFLITGDKRGLGGVKDIPEYVESLDGQVVVLEAVLAALCIRLGVDAVRTRIRPLMEIDVATRICFSDLDSSPLIGLFSYYNDLVDDLAPLNLWSPNSS